MKKRKIKSQGLSFVLEGRNESKESGLDAPKLFQFEGVLVLEEKTTEINYGKLAHELITGTKDWNRFVEMPVGEYRKFGNVVAYSIWIICFFSWIPLLLLLI